MPHTRSPRHHENLIRCDTCGHEAFVTGVDETVSFECAAESAHNWSEVRNPPCVRCGERLSRHLYATSTEHGEAYICPHVLSAHTFAQVK